METTTTEFLKEPTLFKALEFIGIHIALDEQRSQKTGPILLRVSEGSEALLLVTNSDHATFESWMKDNPDPSEADIRKFARAAITRIMDKSRYEQITDILKKG